MLTAHGTLANVCCSKIASQRVDPLSIVTFALAASSTSAAYGAGACSMFTVHVLPQMVYWKIGKVTLVTFVENVTFFPQLQSRISYLFVFLN